MKEKANSKSFIEKAKTIHGDRYDYSNVKYVNAKTHVEIICPIHGVFLQTPDNHINNKTGCPKCAIERNSEKTKLGKDGFVERARSIHGDRYDYSNVSYINYTTKVEIICPIHGSFFQSPAEHFLCKEACPSCNKDKLSSKLRMPQEEFIERSIAIHNGKYDYSKVNYINARTKVTITCPVHGDFLQIPDNHLSGFGCKKCSAIELSIKDRKMKKYAAKNRIDTKYGIGAESFIERAKTIHGDRYDYSKVRYSSNTTKVEIICPIHGVFLQTPKVHLRAKIGCPKCASVHIGDNNKLSNQDFIERAKTIHGDRYDYSKVRYSSNTTKVEIICPIHGSFFQSPSDHIHKKAGCPKCAIELKANNNTWTSDEFIEKARSIHGDRYDYSKVRYSSNTTKVEIICPIHGSFFQSPSDHIHKKAGCPKCSSPKGELALIKIFEKHKIEYFHEYKIPNLISPKIYYDFYLPAFNTLVEFHGIQHFKYIPYFHNRNEDLFIHQKNRDELARKMARQFRYKYVEFNYLQFKKKTTQEFEEFVLRKIGFNKLNIKY